MTRRTTRRTTHRPTRRAVARTLVYLSLVAASVVVLLPLGVVLLTSLKTESETADSGGALTPPRDPFHFANYVTAFQDAACSRRSPTPPSSW